MECAVLKTDRRDPAIDSAKGLLILMVVYAHCFTSGIVHDFFFSFHMPAFFVISGLTGALSKEADRPFIITIKKLLRTIGIPYLFFEMLGIVQELIRNGFSQTWKGFLYTSLTIRCNNIVDWFLATLLLGKIISVGSRKLLGRLFALNTANKIYAAVSFAAMIIAAALPFTEPFGMIVIRRTIIANGFIAVGLIFEPFIRRKALIPGICAFAGAFLLSLLNTDYADINELHFGSIPVFFCAALMGTYGVMQISKLIDVIPLRWLGKNSLIIMGTHIPILLLARHFAGVTDPTVWRRVFDFILIMIVELPIIWFLNHVAPWLIGKKREKGTSKDGG